MRPWATGIERSAAGEPDSVQRMSSLIGAMVQSRDCPAIATAPSSPSPLPSRPPATAQPARHLPTTPPLIAPPSPHCQTQPVRTNRSGPEFTCDINNLSTNAPHIDWGHGSDAVADLRWASAIAEFQQRLRSCRGVRTPIRGWWRHMNRSRLDRTPVRIRRPGCGSWSSVPGTGARRSAALRRRRRSCADRL